MDNLDEVLIDAVTMGLYLSEVDDEYWFDYRNHLMDIGRTDLID